MATRYEADLHIHTLLSPCAEIEMIPPLIIEAAIEAGLDLIAVTDHNSAENARAVVEAAEESPLRVLPGLECESVEGVHILCMFDRVEDAESMQDIIYSALPDIPNQPEKLGDQMVVTAQAEFVRYNERLLIAPTSLTIDEIVDAALSMKGIIVPSHIDRTAYGLLGVLGFIPEGSRFSALEISPRIQAEAAREIYPDLNGWALTRSSDAHWLDEIGKSRTVFYLEHRNVSEMRLAFQGEGGRRVEI